MIVGLDSATPPTAAQALAARNAGCSLWSGYLQTKPNVGLYHAWGPADFENARRCGSTPIAFCSGWDDPNACRQLAAQWNVRLCLDVESGIRGDGAWVQPWLDASDAGLYGNLVVHSNRRAAFHVLAWYLADPKATWPTWAVHPPSPCGWQWKNTFQAFGVGVDSAYYDDWFGGSVNATAGSEVRAPQEENMTGEDLVRIWYWIAKGDDPSPADLQNDVANLKPGSGPGRFAQILASPEAKAHWAKVVGAGAQGPQGPPGPPGPAGPPGPPGAPLGHSHKIIEGATGPAE